jgi:hypothetical protein
MRLTIEAIEATGSITQAQARLEPTRPGVALVATHAGSRLKVITLQGGRPRVGPWVQSHRGRVRGQGRGGVGRGAGHRDYRTDAEPTELMAALRPYVAELIALGAEV